MADREQLVPAAIPSAWQVLPSVIRQTAQYFGITVAIFVPGAIANAWLRGWSRSDTREHVFSVLVVSAMVVFTYFVLGWFGVVLRNRQARRGNLGAAPTDSD